jgi:nucleotide-binding universal stress UspA family protein
LDFALELAQKYNAKLWIVHIVKVDGKIPDELEREFKKAHIKDVFYTYAQLAGRKVLDKAAKKAIDKGVNYETYARAGDPTEDIVSLAKYSGVDFIVLGSASVGKVKRFLHSSVTDKIVRESPCTVTIVQ